MTPTHTRKRGRLFRYYVSARVVKGEASTSPVSRVPAGPVETAVIDQIRTILQSPEVVVDVWRTFRKDGHDITEAEVRESLVTFDDLWAELFPAEQSRIVRLLVERVEVHEDGLDIRLRTAGIRSLLDDLRVDDRSEDTA